MMVPGVRFPAAGNWGEIKLIDITDKKVKWSFTGGPFGSNLKSSDYVANGIRIIQLQNIGDGEFIDEYKIYTSEDKADELLSCNIYPGEIILSKMGDPVGRACLIPDKHSRYVMCSDGIRLVVDEQRFNKYLVYSLINWTTFRKLVEKTATGSTRKRIGLDDLKNIPIVLPYDLAEQQKIADCLSSLDDLIAAHSQKLDALKTHKKGLMQELFPGEGETVPRLRFPEFRDAGEWEELKLIDITDKKIKWSFIGGPFGSNLKSSDYVSHGVRIIQLQNIGDAEFIDEYKIYTSEKKANELVSCNIYPGDIILSKMGDPVGRACLIPNTHSRYVMCSDGIRLVVDEKRFSKYFIYSLINSLQFRALIEKSSTGSTRKRIGLDDLKNLSMSVPCQLSEQQKIAGCLSSLDDLIVTQSQKLESLKAHKKGLMQQLFPNPNEIDE